MQKLTLIVAVLLVGILKAQHNCNEAFELMYSQWESIENMQYNSLKHERHLDKTSIETFEFTVQRSPFKVAGKMGNGGHYILFDSELNENQALYISNGFPYTNIWLDVNGKIFRGLNHYTISDAGCEFIFGIIENEFKRIPEAFSCKTIERNGEREIVVAADTDDFIWEKYTPKRGETALSIAAKLNVSAYLLLERNGLSAYDEDCFGKTIEVPSHYGKVVKMHISASHGMPTLIENYDEKGLFERYEYSNYRINPSLHADFFTEDFLDDLE